MMMLLTAWSRVAERFWPGFRKFQGFSLRFLFSFCLVYVFSYVWHIFTCWLCSRWDSGEGCEGDEGVARNVSWKTEWKRNMNPKLEIWSKFREGRVTFGKREIEKEDQFWADLDLLRDFFLKVKANFWKRWHFQWDLNHGARFAARVIHQQQKIEGQRISLPDTNVDGQAKRQIFFF